MSTGSNFDDRPQLRPNPCADESEASNRPGGDCPPHDRSWRAGSHPGIGSRFSRRLHTRAKQFQLCSFDIANACSTFSGTSSRVQEFSRSLSLVERNIIAPPLGASPNSDSCTHQSDHTIQHLATSLREPREMVFRIAPAMQQSEKIFRRLTFRESIAHAKRPSSTR